MPKPIPPLYGAVLRLWRWMRGLTGGELAARAGAESSGLITMYESDPERNLSREKLDELLALMDVPPEAGETVLHGLALGGPTPAGPASPADPTDEERRLIDHAAARAGHAAAAGVRRELTAAVRRKNAEAARREAASSETSSAG